MGACLSNSLQYRPRIACRLGGDLAYDEMRQAGATDQEAHDAAVVAVQTVLALPWKEATVEAVNAIAYATRYRSDWFWKGAEHIRKWRGTVH